jgi:hypothetical protein
MKVYIASPYTIGDVAVNVKRQLDVASALIDLGFEPYAPLLSHFLHIAHPKEYETWMHLSFVFLRACDAVLRLDGESKGADREVGVANEIGRPVVFSIAQLVHLRDISVRSPDLESA